VSEDEMMPANASRHSVKNPYLAWPAKRSGRSKVTSTWRKPTQVDIARSTRTRSRMPRNHVDHAAIHQPELAGIERPWHLCHALHQPVERLGGGDLPGGLAAAREAAGVDHVVALAPFRHHVGDQLGRVLEVGVDQHDRVAARGIDAGGQGRLVAEIARQRDDLDARVLRVEREQGRERAVAAPVVDEDQLEVQAERCERGDQPPMQLGGGLLLVVARDDD
jgi:hypothetical protein